MKKVFNIIWLVFLLTGTIAYGQTMPKGKKSFEAFKQQLLMQLQHRDSYRYFPEQQQPVVQNREKSATVSPGYGKVPSVGWAEQFGGSADDYGMDVAVDKDGNGFVGGYFAGKINDGGKSFTSKGNIDGFIARFDPNGQLIWFTQLPATPGSRVIVHAVCIDKNNNVYATGYYTGTAIFGSYTLTSHASYNPFLIKLNASGKILMAQTFYGIHTDDPEMGRKIKLDSLGNIYIISSQSMNSNSSTLLSKFDLAGKMVWKQYHSQNFSDMVISGRDIYLTGVIFRGDPDNGYLDDSVTLPVPSSAYYEIFYTKADLNGQFIWGKSLQHSNYGYSQSPHIGGGSFLYLTGFSAGSTSLDTIQLKGGNNFFCKINTENGHVLYANEFQQHGSSPLGIVAGAEGSIYISERATITKFDKTGVLVYSKPLNYSFLESFFLNSKGKMWTTGTFNEHIRTALMDTLGNEKWNVEFNGDAARGRVLDMTTDNTGNVYTYAYASNPLDFYGYQLKKGLFVCKQNSKGSIVWLKQFPGNYNAFYNYTGNLITIDPGNNYFYITGSVDGSFNIPNGPSVSGTFLIKFDLLGNYVWSYHTDIPYLWSRQLDLAADHSGNIVWSGVFNDTIEIGTQPLISAGYQDVFIAKFDKSGQFLWAKRAGGESVEYNGLVATNREGDVYLSGEFYSQNVTIGNTSITLNEGDGNILLAKLDKNGNVLWVKSKAGSTQSYGDYYCWPTGMETGPSGDVYMKGWHGPSARFDTILLTSPYPYNYFVGKFDPKGNTIWAKSINEHRYGFDYNQFGVDIKGNMYIGAEARDTIEFGKEYTYINQSPNDQFVARYSPAGKLDWVKPVPGNSTSWSWITAVVVSGNNVYVGGRFNNLISFGSKVLKSRNQIHGFTAQLIQPHNYFTPVWSGNPYQPMNIVVKSADIYGTGLKGNDEIGVFTKDSLGHEICVGDGRLTAPIKSGQPLTITVSADDPTTSVLDGFKSGTPIYYKIWSAGKQLVFSNVSANYDTTYDKVFTPLGTAVVSLSAYGHYHTVWSGNPYNPMNILVDSIILPDSGVKPGDEVGVFDKNKTGESICVGVGIIAGPVSSKYPLAIVASADDPGTSKTDGFVKGHQITYKIWSSATQKEYKRLIAKYNPAMDSLFSPLGTALVSLKYQTKINQAIPLGAGWNIMSFYVVPDTLNMLTVLHSLISSHQLIKVIDEKGNFIQNIPGVGWMNTIGNMANTEGYYIKVTKNDTLTSSGKPVVLPFNIPLQTGWNMMGYPVQKAQSAVRVLKKLMDSSVLIKVMSQTGGFIQNIPGVGWMNTIGNFNPGEGYYIKVKTNSALTFNNPTTKLAPKPATPKNTVLPKPEYFRKAYSNNPYYPMNIVVTRIDLPGYTPQPGDEIAVFDKNVCVGVGKVSEDVNKPVNIVVSLDDPLTRQKDGYTVGNPVNIKYMSPKLNSPVNVTLNTLSGGPLFTPLGTVVCGINASPDAVKSHLKTEGFAIRIYPNPAHGKLTFEINNDTESHVKIEVLDITGKNILTVNDKTLEKGSLVIRKDLSSLHPGMYFVRVVRLVKNQTSVENLKLILTK